MAITTLDGLIGAAKQVIAYLKTASRTTIASGWFSYFDVAGNPGGGTLAGSSTANGVVPTDATAGCPTINAFGGGAKGYLSQIDFGNTVACRMRLFDMLFKAGAYAFNAATSLASQPAYSSRIPGGTDYNGLQIWFEAVTAFTGNLSLAVTYTNEAGTTGRTTGTIAFGFAPTLGRMVQLPLQAGDRGVQKIESVTATVSSVGTFNILVLRELWSARVRSVNDGGTHGPLETGMPEVFADSALVVAVCPDSTAGGIPELGLVISNG